MPGHLVIVDQFIDRTKVRWRLRVLLLLLPPPPRHTTHRGFSAGGQTRQVTFYEKGVVAHVSFGEPTCKVLRGLLLQACADACVTFHAGGARGRVGRGLARR